MTFAWQLGTIGISALGVVLLISVLLVLLPGRALEHQVAKAVTEKSAKTAKKCSKSDFARHQLNLVSGDYLSHVLRAYPRAKCYHHC